MEDDDGGLWASLEEEARLAALADAQYQRVNETKKRVVHTAKVSLSNLVSL